MFLKAKYREWSYNLTYSEYTKSSLPRSTAVWLGFVLVFSGGGMEVVVVFFCLFFSKYNSIETAALAPFTEVPGRFNRIK